MGSPKCGEASTDVNEKVIDIIYKCIRQGKSKRQILNYVMKRTKQRSMQRQRSQIIDIDCGEVATPSAAPATNDFKREIIDIITREKLVWNDVNGKTAKGKHATKKFL